MRASTRTVAAVRKLPPPVLEKQVEAPAPEKYACGKTGLTSLNRLHCFEVVVQESGFKRATSRLHITQPALSYQMKHLEGELGVQLFVRRPGGVSLTDAGRLLYAHVQRVSAAVRRAEEAVKELPAVGVRRPLHTSSTTPGFRPTCHWRL